MCLLNLHFAFLKHALIYAAGKQNFTVRIGGDVEAAKELVVHQDEVDDESDSERAEKNQDADNDVRWFVFEF